MRRSYSFPREECIIVCVNAKFVDLFQARFEHLLGGLFQHGKTQIVKKHQRDVSSIEGEVLALYGRDISQRDIAATVEDIYGFKNERMAKLMEHYDTTY